MAARFVPGKPLLYQLLFLSCLANLPTLAGEPFRLPTANQFLFEKGAEDKFLAPTPGKDWVTGSFGCVRSDGNQMHEGLDIRSLQRDRRGEPTDPVMATADGTVMYFNTKAALSNYGKYIVLRHMVDGLEVYSLYAHLQEIGAGLRVGQTVKSGEVIGLMGRTSNTSETITKDRAHVHFELNLFYSDHFNTWFQRNNPKEKNDHGLWNGQNLGGLDPRLVLLAEHQEGGRFNLLTWLQRQPEFCRVLVRKTDLLFARRYLALVAPNSLAQQKGVAGYEIALDYNGVPIRLIPRAAEELHGLAGYQLLSVNEELYNKCNCRKLVRRTLGRFQLAPNGRKLLDLLTE